MSHESIKVLLIGRLAKGKLHRAPIPFIQIVLLFCLQSHKQIISDEIRLTERKAGGVHAFKNKLGIILVTVQGNIHNKEFCHTAANGDEIHTTCQ